MSTPSQEQNFSEKWMDISQSYTDHGDAIESDRICTRIELILPQILDLIRLLEDIAPEELETSERKRDISIKLENIEELRKIMLGDANDKVARDLVGSILDLTRQLKTKLFQLYGGELTLPRS